MSLMTDSPADYSSSDDLVAYLDAELGANSSESSLEDDEVDGEPSKEPDNGDDQLDGERIKRRKVEIFEKTYEEEVSTSDGALEKETETSSKVVTCMHPGSFGGLCISCGESWDVKSGVTFPYIHKGLRLGNDEILRLRNADMKNLLSHRKLYLVLDLDHTLLNSTFLFKLTPAEEYLKSQAESTQDVPKGSLFRLDFMNMMTKLRPFVRTFLKEASQMFEMYIYTMGDRRYALQMAKLLDPCEEYFDGRVISRDDGTHRHQKSLDLVLGQESFVVILDDTQDAWPKHKDNLILMEKYHFFASSSREAGFNCQSLAELKNDESEPDGALAAVLKALKRIHRMFFDELGDDLAARDVRQVLQTLRKEVMKGCKIDLPRVIHTRFPPAFVK